MTVCKVKPSLLAYLRLPETRRPFVESVHSYSPFQHLLTSFDLGQFPDSFTEVHCVVGEIVVREDEAGNSLFLIRSGGVVIVKGDLDSPFILDYRGAGEIFGEMAILENQPRSASVIALEDMELLKIERQKFERLLKEMPSVSLDVMEMLSSRLRKSDEARNIGELSKRLLRQQVSSLQSEIQQLEELQRRREENTELVMHDLRNPLSTISMAIKLLTLTIPEKVLHDNQELLGIAQTSCERMQQMVELLLDVSCMEAGEEQFIASSFDMAVLIDEVARRCQLLVRKGVSLRTSIAPGLPLVIGDRDKIERVLENLADNAAKFTPEMGNITFTAERDEKFIRVSVADTGPGIPEQERERIFDRFTQISTDKMPRSGFGLGLTYCRLAVEKHGGRIYIEDGEDGSGSRFVFTLPITPNRNQVNSTIRHDKQSGVEQNSATRVDSSTEGYPD